MARHAIVGQWGTTRLQLALIDLEANGELIEAPRVGPGASALAQSEFEDALFTLCADWLGRSADAPIILNGMVGSTIGWRAAPYASTPVGCESIARHAVGMTVRGRHCVVLPGVRARNAFDEPDVMRGEETEVMGYLQMSADQHGSRLICVPGTHTKWVRVSDGRIEALHTVFTGELYRLLVQHSTLARGPYDDLLDEAGFDTGLAAGTAVRGARCLHALFSVRAMQVIGEASSAWAKSYLSGLLIGADVAGMRALAPHWFADDSSISIIGATELNRRFESAMRMIGRHADILDAGAASRAGFAAIARCLS